MRDATREDELFFYVKASFLLVTSFISFVMALYKRYSSCISQKESLFLTDDIEYQRV